MAGARRRLRPLRVIRLSITAWIRRVAPAGTVPSAWIVGSWPACMNPPAAAAIWPRAVVARAIAVAACRAWLAWAADSAELRAGAGGMGPNWIGGGGEANTVVGAAWA